MNHADLSHAPPRGEHVVIVGGGVIGAFCALELVGSGRKVTIVDAGRFGGACSHGNCGYVCPSHILPLAAPGAMSGAVRAMLRPNSPFKIKLRPSPSLWSWLWHFARRCNKADMMVSAKARHALLQSSMTLYRQLMAEPWMQCEWSPRGLLMVHHEPREFEEFESTNEMLRREFGVFATPHDRAALERLEPALRPGLGGGWHFEQDCHLRPDRLLACLRARLESLGAEIREDWQVRGLRRGGAHVTAVVNQQDEAIEGERFVIAAGALTPQLAAELGCRVPIQPGKGYSITSTPPRLCPRLPMIFEAHRVAVTPFEGAYRLGSTMEFAGYDNSLNPKRLALLQAGARHYLEEPLGTTIQERWFGWRPMTWDGLPLIGPSPRLNNLLLAAGHNMLGLSMAPATGRLIREWIDGEPAHLDPTAYLPARFG
ncbi:MAG: FAD-dependent oxidoreductase [Planctomycetales bacterium]|nr:FAD-dependent oxidoreductase [Planctomycetales bacterium]